MKQAIQVAQNGSATTYLPSPPQHHHSGGAELQVAPQAPQQVYTPAAVVPQVYYQPAVPATAPLVSPGKLLVYGGAAFLVLWLIDYMMRPRPRYEASTLPIGAGGMQGLLPAGVAGIVGWLLLSKMVRGEIKGWGEAINHLTKSIDAWGK